VARTRVRKFLFPTGLVGGTLTLDGGTVAAAQLIGRVRLED